MLLVAAPFLFGTFSSLAIFLVALYCIYWIIRALILTIKEPAPVGPPPAPVVARPDVFSHEASAHPARAVRSRHSRLPRWARHEKPAAAMVVKPFRHRLTELVGSMLAGAVIAILVCVMGFVLASLRSNAVVGAEDLARYAWVILASVIGTWAVMIPAKVWEGYKGDVKLRRFTMMLAGLVVGLFVAAISAGLLVDLPNNELLDMELNDLTGLEPVRLTTSNVVSDLRYYLVGFGALFLLLRWWRSADPMRVTRFEPVCRLRVRPDCRDDLQCTRFPTALVGDGGLCHVGIRSIGQPVDSTSYAGFAGRVQLGRQSLWNDLQGLCSVCE